MYRKMISRATLPGCIVLALAWAMLALPGSSLADPPPHNHGGGGGDDGDGGGTIPVTVTFRDFPGDVFDPVPDHLMSDGLGDYIHKVDKVGAGISTRGNFRIAFTKGNKPAIRTLFYDFSDCIEGPCVPPFPSGFSVGPANMHATGVNMREMLVGEVRDDVRLAMGLDLTSVGGGVWSLFFDPLDDRCPGSTNITVRRIAADTWEIEAGTDDVACLVEVVGGGEFLFSGRYHMPFKITVKRK